MEWINEPVDNATDTVCVIRICSDKGACDGYLCLILFCTTNAQRFLITNNHDKEENRWIG